MINETVKTFRKQRELTQAAFAQALCERLPGVDLTKQAISNWERGAQTPNYLFLTALVMAYGDWRHEFALACLEVLRPAVWSEPTKEE